MDRREFPSGFLFGCIEDSFATKVVALKRSAAWMKFLVHAFEFAVLDLGVDLCRFDACVSKHFLDQSQVGSACEQVSGEAMTEGVWAGFRIDSDPFRVAFDQFPDRFAAQSLSGARDDDPRSIFGVSVGDEDGARLLQVLFDDFDGSLAQGDHPLFASFAFGQAVAFVE